MQTIKDRQPPPAKMCATLTKQHSMIYKHTNIKSEIYLRINGKSITNPHLFVNNVKITPVINGLTKVEPHYDQLHCHFGYQTCQKFTIELLFCANVEPQSILDRLVKVDAKDQFFRGGDEILTLSLKDPITMSKLIVPVRSKNCKHLGSFDGRNFLLSGQNKCPICATPISAFSVQVYPDQLKLQVTDQLQICQFTLDYLGKSKEDSIQLYGDGNEVEVKPQPSRKLSDVKNQPEVIDLTQDSSSDEEVPVTKKRKVRIEPDDSQESDGQETDEDLGFL